MRRQLSSNKLTASRLKGAGTWAFSHAVPVAALTVLLAGAAIMRAADASKTKTRSGPQPALSVPIATLGYQPQSAAIISQRLSTNSLDFIDNDHLLLTFRNVGLMKRLPDAQPGDEDQSIHAVVLELPSGKVLRSADWRMHDHGRYLWSLQNGTFLVRQRDTLYLTDANLELRPYMKSPARLEAVQPSADGKLLVMQVDQERHSADEHQRLVQQALDVGAMPPREDVKVVILRADTGAVLATSQATRPVNLPVLREGYLESLPAKAGHWQLRYLTFAGEKKVFGDVLSTCAPTEVVATSSVSLLITCIPKTDDHLVQGIDLDGKILWQFWLGSTQIWPSYRAARDGSRFAISTLHSTHGISALEPVVDEDIKGQRVQVLDPIGGGAVLTVNESPATAPDENYSLSPDGKKFAILSKDAVEVYDVPDPVLREPAKPRKK